MTEKINAEIPEGKLIKSKEQFEYAKLLAEGLQTWAIENKRAKIEIEKTCQEENWNLEDTLRLYKKNIIICISWKIPPASKEYFRDS